MGEFFRDPQYQTISRRDGSTMRARTGCGNLDRAAGAQLVTITNNSVQLC
jgi:hypothetical protein